MIVPITRRYCSHDIVYKAGNDDTAYRRNRRADAFDDASGALTEEIVWLEDIPIATLRFGAGGGIEIYYIHTDHLNTPRLITDAVNTARWRWDGEPFGAGTVNHTHRAPRCSISIYGFRDRF